MRPHPVGNTPQPSTTDRVADTGEARDEQQSLADLFERIHETTNAPEAPEAPQQEAWGWVAPDLQLTPHQSQRFEGSLSSAVEEQETLSSAIDRKGLAEITDG